MSIYYYTGSIYIYIDTNNYEYYTPLGSNSSPTEKEKETIRRGRLQVSSSVSFKHSSVFLSCIVLFVILHVSLHDFFVWIISIIMLSAIPVIHYPYHDIISLGICIKEMSRTDEAANSTSHEILDFPLVLQPLVFSRFFLRSIPWGISQAGWRNKTTIKSSYAL